MHLPIHTSLGLTECTTQKASRSVHRFCTTHGRVASSIPGHVHSPTIAPLHTAIWTHLIHGFWGPPDSKPQTASRSVQPFLHGHRIWTVQSYSLGCTNVNPHVTHAFLSPPKFTTQTASRSLQPFLHSSRQSVVGMPGHVFSPKNCPLA